MALSYNARKRLSILLLVVWLPLYILGAVAVMSSLDRPPVWLEFLIYALLGVLWAVPFRWVFLGVGRADPDAPPEE